MKVFKLPDLGEGLVEAEIVEWHAGPGDEVAADQPLVSVETDKAVVEVPAPRTGRIAKLHAAPGDIVPIGAVLVEFDGGADEISTEAPPARPDKGAVVGEVTVNDQVVNERASRVGSGALGVKATPAVRALGKRLDVDLGIVTPSGPDGLISRSDVERVAKILAELGPIEKLRGPRRVMARHMSMARAEVAPATVSEDADIGQWREEVDATQRLIRAVVAGCRAEPCLNAWYDSHSVGRRVLEKIHLGIALDTPDGCSTMSEIAMPQIFAKDSNDSRRTSRRAPFLRRSFAVTPSFCLTSAPSPGVMRAQSCSRRRWRFWARG
jgi:pyruvate dehydrogenase E2 component (dihydrolipoamide acetyltransferase)